MTNKEAAYILSYQCCNYSTEELHMAFDLAIKALEERPQGEWIDYSGDEGYVECPICGCLTTCEGNIDELHYCWNCGADMRGGRA